MNRNFLGFFALALGVLLLASCHSNEANYRRSYDKAMERYEDGDAATVYQSIQAERRRYTEVVDGDSVRVLRMHANVHDDSTIVAQRFNVVIASFTQAFNATNYRDRLRKDFGYPSYVLYGGLDDKKYYVVAKGFDDKSVAVAFLHDLNERGKVKVLDPIPWILVKL